MVSVPEGDSLTVQKTDGSHHKLRLYGVDAPESGQAWSEASQQAVSELAMNKWVEVNEQYKGQYQRIVAIVTLPDGRVLQEVMLEGGITWVDERYCKQPVCDNWRQKMAAARTARRGLWHALSPTPPWEWHKGLDQEKKDKSREGRANKWF